MTARENPHLRPDGRPRSEKGRFALDLFALRDEVAELQRALRAKDREIERLRACLRAMKLRIRAAQGAAARAANRQDAETRAEG